jgi:O-antigen/teichoic acid export membrane protein
VLNILFLAVLHMGITGYVLSIVLADVFCALMLFVKEKLWRQITLHPGWDYWKEMLLYSIPMIPATVFWWITSVSDRYMVTGFISESANGIYAVSYKLPTILTLVSGIFMEAWQFSAISEAGDKKEHAEFFSRVWCAFQAMLFVVGAFITGFAQLGVKILAAPSYYEAWTYVPVLGIAMVFSSFVSYLGSVYMVEKRSGRTFMTAMIGAVLNIILNLILIPSPLGVQGAAIATAASYIIVFVIRAVDARRFIPFKLYTLGVIENFLLLTVQTVFMVLQLPGWLAVQAACIVLMLLINRKPLFATLARIKNIRKH